MTTENITPIQPDIAGADVALAGAYARAPLNLIAGLH
jgi:hypothetical protein